MITCYYRIIELPDFRKVKSLNPYNFGECLAMQNANQMSQVSYVSDFWVNSWFVPRVPKNS